MKAFFEKYFGLDLGGSDEDETKPVSYDELEQPLQLAAEEKEKFV